VILEKEYNKTHGYPWDRGSADSYYGRPIDPHYYPEGTGHGKRIEASEMSKEELEAYHAGYLWNEQYCDKKSW